jgi:hypothetical protein
MFHLDNSASVAFRRLRLGNEPKLNRKLKCQKTGNFKADGNFEWTRANGVSGR